MFSMLITILFLLLVAKFIPYGENIAAVLIAVIILRWLNLLPVIVAF